ncbi:MAG: hypothetical protein ABII85_01400 [Bacillota bacterium]
MKWGSKNNIIAITGIIIIITALGFQGGAKLINDIAPIINLPKIAFAGFISFFLVGCIMAISAKIGIWYGKIGGSILYAIVLTVVGFIMF